MVFSLPDDQLFVVRVQALFLSTTNKAPGDLSSTTLISQKASNHNAPALKPESTPPVSRAPICRAGSGVQAPFPLSRKGVTLGQGTHLLPGPVDSVCHAAFQPP